MCSSDLNAGVCRNVYDTVVLGAEVNVLHALSDELIGEHSPVGESYGFQSDHPVRFLNLFNRTAVPMPIPIAETAAPIIK